MIPTLALNPFLGAEIAAVLQTSVLVGYVLDMPARFHRAQSAIKMRTRMLWSFLEDMGAGTFLLFGVVFLYIAIFWCAGAWTYADWRYQLPSVILLLVIGVQYMIRPLQNAQHRWRLLFAGIAAGILLVLLQGIISGLAIMGPVLETYLPVLLGSLLGGVFIFGVIKAIITRKRPVQEGICEREKVIPLFTRMFSLSVNVILWVLAVAQGIFAFLGYSWFSFG